MVASLLLPASHSGTRWEQREDLTPIPFNQQNLLERATGRLPPDVLDPAQNHLVVLARVGPAEHEHQRPAVRVVHLVLLLDHVHDHAGELQVVTKTLGLFQGVQAAGEVSTG